ncbi:MAG: hypothetical protein ACFFAU_00410 [Candidatus Hodarchaeota archaeon]
MSLDSEIRLALQRIENALQHVMEFHDFRNFMLAKSYLDEGQIHTSMQFLKRIENSSQTANKVIVQSLFIRALILVYDLQFTDGLALLVRIRNMDFEKDEQLMKDLNSVIQDIKIQQQASAMYDTTEGRQIIETFRETTMNHLENYLASAKQLVRG